MKLFDTKERRERRERMRAQVHSTEAERESLAAVQMLATDTRTYKV